MLYSQPLELKEINSQRDVVHLGRLTVARTRSQRPSRTGIGTGGVSERPLWNRSKSLHPAATVAAAKIKEGSSACRAIAGAAACAQVQVELLGSQGCSTSRRQSTIEVFSNSIFKLRYKEIRKKVEAAAVGQRCGWESFAAAHCKPDP